ncbi:MAG: MSMEG_0570 family nitrogen starvation response protein [Verrucomicrobiota bacterium]
MPETPFTVELPDGTVRQCYSPSSIVHKYFSRGETMPVSEFLTKARAALTKASERVEAKFGFACSGATASLATIEAWGATLKPEDPVKIIQI